MRCKHFASKVIRDWAEPQNRREAEAGQSIVIMVIGLIALLAFAGLVFDGGTAYAQFRRMQNAADAGALAGALELTKKAATSDRTICEVVFKYAHDLNGSPVYGRQSEPYVQVQYIMKDGTLVELQNCDIGQ